MFSTKEIAKATGGQFDGADVKVSSVSTDTRSLQKGALFIALKGENFDGNDYIPKAAALGAAAAVSDRAGLTADIPIIRVKDGGKALLDIARNYRERFNVKLCGVTGSVGKTSTKDMIYAVLSAKYKTLKTEGNLNNTVGEPEMLLRLNNVHEAAVIEMGMSGRGEISAMSAAARPDCCVITNIGWCHIEQLKTRENILAAKLEILDGASENAPLIVCGDDEFLGGLTKEQIKAHKLIKYGFNEDNDVRAVNVTHINGGEEFTLRYKNAEFNVRLNVVGEHHILNALAAFAVGVEFGMNAEEIIPAFLNYEASGMRQRIEKRGDVTVILDCYNASPTSMKSALNVLSTMSGRKIAVLGDMLELGEKSRELHAGLAEFSELADEFFLCGEEMAALREELVKKGVRVTQSADKEKLSEELLKEIKSGDVILFKGSRGMKMEEIAEKIGGNV